MTFRIEQKIMFNAANLDKIYKWLSDSSATELFESRRINSIYFDNYNFDLYRDSNEGVLPRKKYRIRCYNHCDHLFQKHNLELKISSIEGRFKSSTSIENIDQIFRNGLFDPIYGQLFPVIEIQYLRSYFEVFGIRLTIDEKIRYSNFDEFNRVGGLYGIEDENLAVEVKAPDLSFLKQIEDLISFNRARFSKYSRGIEALELAP